MWLVAVGVLMVAAWGDPQSRTQEARVLLGAREMLGKPLEGWLIPTANGEPRLNKPPLAYWASAVSYSLLGTSVWAGRLPAVLASALTLGLTWMIGQRLFCGRVGLYAAGTLLGSWLFFRYGPLAETDVLGMLWMTLSGYAILRAREGSNGWFYLIAACIGALAMTKGPPAGYVLLLMFGTDLIDRRFRSGQIRTSLLVRFVTTGAIVVTLVISLPWFLYAFQNVAGHELVDDLSNSARGGRGHAEPWWTYFPELLLATLPWTPIWILAGWASIKVILKQTNSSQQDRTGLMWLYTWGLSVLVPLMFWGNKQPHYLLAMIPAAMLTVGWVIDRATGLDWPTLRIPVESILRGMRWLGLFAALAVIGVAWKFRPGISWIDITTACGVIIVMLFVLGFSARHPVFQERMTLIGCVGLLLLLKSIWAPTLEPPTAEDLARELNQRFPHATFVFRGPPSMTLCLAMKRIIPSLTDEQLIELAARQKPDQTILCLYETEKEPTPLEHFRVVLRLEAGEQDLIVAEPRSTTTSSGIFDIYSKTLAPSVACVANTTASILNRD